MLRSITRRLREALHLNQTRVFLERILRLSVWFPHVPIAVAVGTLGTLQLVPPVLRALGGSGSILSPGPWADELASVAIEGLPQGIVGGFMVAMAVGLLLRSRFAWIVTIVMTIASVALSKSALTVVAEGSISYEIVLLLVLVAAGRRFNRSSLAAGTLFAMISIVLLLTYAILVSYVIGDEFSPPIRDFGTALYFAVVTMSTVGYGDVLPVTQQARLFVVSIIVFGITIFATSISAIVVPLISRRMQRLMVPGDTSMNWSNHYVITGDTALARNTCREFLARGEHVTVIADVAPEEGAFGSARVIVGDGSEVDVLKRADADRAAAILALDGDDSENAFVVLAAHELGGTAKTVASVSNAKNISRVRKSQPDMIIAPEVLGSELLVTALSGGRIDGDELLSRLLSTE